MVTNTTLLDALTTTFLVVCGVIGIVESVRRDQAGLAVLFVLVLVAGIGASITRRRQRRRPVLVRADLHRWLATTAAVTGESVADLTDRCISSYRAGIQQ